MNKRRSIEVAGLQHENPIPIASQIGPWLVTSGIFGKDTTTGKIPTAIEEQCAHLFANIRLILTAVGGTPDDIIKLTVWLRDKSHRTHINKEWLAMFPDEHSRPARHTFQNPDLPEAALVQAEVMAVISAAN